MLVFPLLLFPQGAFIRSINLHYAASNRIVLFLKHTISRGLEVGSWPEGVALFKVIFKLARNLNSVRLVILELVLVLCHEIDLLPSVLSIGTH